MSLRRRVALVLGFGSLLVTSMLAAATWHVVSDHMVRQREIGAVRQAEANVRLVESSLGSTGLGELLTGLATGPDSSILLLRPGNPLTAGRPVDVNELPLDSVPARQRVVVGGLPVMAVTMPVDGAVYVQLFPMEQLERAFRCLGGLLVIGIVLSTLVIAALGWWALRPLTQLNTALEQHARFAGDVSHELRSPLTTMVNASDVLRRRSDQLPATARQALELLTSEVDRFARMVVDLLEISRADQVDDEREDVDLTALVRNVAGRVPLELPNHPVIMSADRRRLDRVVANLVDNAERHAGGPTLVAVRPGNGVVRLEVDDAGPGVPAELRERIFERFTRVGGRSAEAGTGLGLALVAEHVRRHGGRVWVEDRRPRGARFVVELPCQE